ncbi:hypothetical protein AQUCO_03700316v1 [Aquilegia coerulea]|uniref:Uncharacterized protein n=1 Tax=Aquilegia coerulea TaxID=218851 RepID=A0A2G5CUL8_AQUCA|nr:hypothetical protein AQUCO_03700316v1 [Aquilegia coerulea]
MGACTSRPKDLDHPQAQLPGEKPSDDLHEPLVTKAQGETTAVAQENSNDDAKDGGESQKVEEPLVDLSDPTSPKEATKTDGGVSDESNNPVADLVAVVDADSNKSDGDEKKEDIDNVVVAASEPKEEVDEKQAAVEKSAESTEEAEK